MSLIKVTEALIAERGFNDELLANLTAAIEGDISALRFRQKEMMDTAQCVQMQLAELERRKEELATEFATRRASLSALIGEEDAGNV